MLEQFDDLGLHGPDSIAMLEAQLARPDLPAHMLLSIAEEMTGHGHRDAMVPIERLRAAPKLAAVHRFCATLERGWSELRRHYALEDQPQEMRDRFYARNGFLVLQSRRANPCLIVAFTTMYNNFWMSSLALAMRLRRTGAHVLVLKDATRCNYHRGVAGLATDMPGIAAGIRDIAARVGAERIVVTGYSSGGYAALLTSLLLPAQGYVGFSHTTDLSAGSPLPQPKHMPPELRAQLDPRWFLNLRDLVAKADPAVPRTLVHGNVPRDIAHAVNLAETPGIELVSLPQAQHNTVVHALADGRFDAMFSRLVAG